MALVAASVALVAGIAGCSGSPQSPPVAPTPSSSASAAPAGDRLVTLSVGGRSRTLILHAPSGAGGRAVPLILVFHGAEDTAAQTARETDFESAADAKGVAVAFLQGYDDTWNEGAGHTPAEQAGVDDVAFTRAALTRIAQLVDVDPSKVAAVGFSNGGLLVDDLGCRLAAELALVVPVAAPLPVSVAASCAPTRAVSVLAVHGTADKSIPYAGGAFAGVGGGTTVLSAAASTKRWAALDGCSSTPARSTPSASVRTTTYSGCRDAQNVELRSLVGAGHAWPAGIGRFVVSALDSSAA